MKVFNIFFGKRGEQIAEKYLKKKGYSILRCNFRSHAGEIDIIAEIGGVLVFTEVKRRSGGNFGKGYEAVGKVKQKKIIRTAQAYLNTLPDIPPCRFDVISIDGEEITHIENAFTA
ncbi:MAG: YraN family protein [Deferribacteraceae bacterium]|jgi:putative endonuclease|nr:YraN family protein [Deferribacteraceae bacterium]